MDLQDKTSGEDIAVQTVERSEISKRAVGRWSERSKGNVLCLLAFLTVVGAVFWRTLTEVIGLALSVDLHSHILLVPFVSAYLVWIRRGSLPPRFVPSPMPAMFFFAIGCVAWGLGFLWWGPGLERLSVLSLAFVLLFIGGVFLFLGADWVRHTVFPLCFLFLLVPLPPALIDALEHASKLASADAADLLFRFGGMTYVRDGTTFHLPGLSFEVAQQCSGIRSSLVLLITGAVAANLLLTETWRRCLLVCLIIPLGILRNAFRIFTLAWLTIHVDPRALNSPLHHHGGPIFFLLSLPLLFLVLWWLRRGEMPVSSQARTAKVR